MRCALFLFLNFEIEIAREEFNKLTETNGRALVLRADGPIQLY